MMDGATLGTAIKDALVAGGYVVGGAESEVEDIWQTIAAVIVAHVQTATVSVRAGLTVGVVTVAAVQNGALYRVTVDATDCDYTSDGSATEGEILDGVEAAVNGEALAVTATRVGSTVVLVSSASILWTVTVSANLAITPAGSVR